MELKQARFYISSCQIYGAAVTPNDRGVNFQSTQYCVIDRLVINPFDLLSLVQYHMGLRYSSVCPHVLATVNSV